MTVLIGSFYNRISLIFFTSLYVMLFICIPESEFEGPQNLNRKTEKKNGDTNKGNTIFLYPLAA